MFRARAQRERGSVEKGGVAKRSEGAGTARESSCLTRHCSSLVLRARLLSVHSPPSPSFDILRRECHLGLPVVGSATRPRVECLRWKKERLTLFRERIRRGERRFHAKRYSAHATPAHARCCAARQFHAAGRELLSPCSPSCFSPGFRARRGRQGKEPGEESEQLTTCQPPSSLSLPVAKGNLARGACH